jgi:uncharacterized membrane protein YjjP (DUF1212 family)
MYVVMVDIVALMLIVAGVTLLLRSSDAASPNAGTYGRRIGGTMLAAFGLAIGMMVTLFHFNSGG